MERTYSRYVPSGAPGKVMRATDLTSPATAPLGPTPAVVNAVRPFGKYFLVRKLAEGGMAEIFLAKQVGAEGFERNVVIKRMLQHLTHVTEFVTMFLDEAKLAVRLAHPNVVQIYELALADGCYYICMEYLAGEDFSAMLRTAARRREYVPLNVVARVVADAAAGLHFAHEFRGEEGEPLQIVHRDVSPSNIFVTYQGQVKMLDFGIAKAEVRIANTTAGVVKGKYMYMSPEQAGGASVDCRADVFSLGVSLYEACTNTRPFARENDLAVLNSVLKCDFIPPRRVRPDLPLELEAIILKAMAAKVEERYQSAAEVAADLETFIASTSSATGGGQVGAYIQSLVGIERVNSRTRIQTLAAMAAQGVDVPGFTNPLSPKTLPEPRPVAPSDDGTRVVGPPSQVRPAPSRRGPLVIAALAGMVLTAGLAVLLRPPPRESTPVPAPPVAVAQPPPVIKPVEQPVPTDSPKPPDVKPAVASQPRTSRKPVTLDEAEIKSRLANYQRVVSPCFVDHRDDLASETGQIMFALTILNTGKVVNAKVLGELAGKPVGRCVEQKLAKLRFPPNTDDELTFNAGFNYSVR